jgi:nucleotide-binding universal stress UspA family protein
MNGIVVGIDYQAPSPGAMRWAAHEAERRGYPVSVVSGHIPLHDLAPLDFPEVADPGLDSIRHDLANWAADYRHGPSEFTTQVEADWPVQALLRHAESDTKMLVVGHRGSGLWERVFTGSTSVAVVGRSPIPVVVVPDDWQGMVDDQDPICVALSLSGSEDPVLDYAFTRAAQLGVKLLVLHAWEVPLTYAWRDGLWGFEDLAVAEKQIPETIERVLEPWRTRFKNVAAEIKFVVDRPVDAVLEYAKTSQLMVLGRHSGAFRRGGLHLGSTVRAVLHHLESPLVVVPHAEVPAADV